MDFAPWSDWVLVAAEPHAQRSVVLAAAGESVVRKGTVRAVGPGKPTARGRDPIGVRPGERVAFLRWHVEHGPGKASARALSIALGAEGEDLVVVREGDILFVMEDGDPSVDA
jgi:co-chaperonin GroES (HSP10)